MRPSARLFRLAVPLAAATLAVAACDVGTDPLVDRIDAELLPISLGAPAVEATHGYVGFISALPRGTPALRRGEAVLVRLSSSRGDAETLRFLAPTPITIEGVAATRVPREYLLVPESGVDFNQLLRDAEAFGVRHIPIGIAESPFACSYVAASDEAAAVAAVRALPGVRFFEPNSIGCVVACEPTGDLLLFAAIPLDTQSNAVTDDGLLTVAAGDTLRIVYRSASGGTATFTTLVQ